MLLQTMRCRNSFVVMFYMKKQIVMVSFFRCEMTEETKELKMVQKFGCLMRLIPFCSFPDLLLCWDTADEKNSRMRLIADPVFD